MNDNLRLSVIDDPAQQLSFITRVEFVPANHSECGSHCNHLDVHQCYLTCSSITPFADWHA